MANWDHQKELDEQRRLAFRLAKDIDCKNKMMMEMASKLDYKDTLLEAALKQMQESRLEREKLITASESQMMQFKDRVRELENEIQDLKAENQALMVKERRICKVELQGACKEVKRENERDFEPEIEDLKAENQALMVKQRACNDELQAARAEAIRELQSMLSHPRAMFSVKKMGEVNSKAFDEMCFKKCGGEGWNWKDESARLHSLWEENVRNPQWHPFKIIRSTNGLFQFQEAIDEDDEKLKQLRNEGDGKVYEAVMNALMELNEYNPSGRYPVPELWNNKEKRRASLREIVEYLIKQLKTIKRKRERYY